ncbi:sodium-proton antiporter [Candidatus Terasakiella magnetica]|uniref:Na(+)/H(+) antiporter NhaA n=2 Tax=Candidatus Terasakiella magnetica TaxID=1867952 RepID=A0A1C3RHA0_9PROT|nr:sodium-proton antiporter [Candidatus Terasakiella magnetica]
MKQILHNKDMLGGVLLITAAVMALLANNSFLSNWYDSLLHIPVTFAFAEFTLSKPLLLWVNDGLMAVFFFLVGLEIKREIVEGELSSFDKAALPVIAAIGGMLIPALTYLAVNAGNPMNMSGWAIPAATDIAFALGVLALLGPSVPVALKVFLLGIAIIDDLGAIVAIALFYTESVSVVSLVIGMTGFGALLVMNKMGVRALAPYILIGIAVWLGVLKSGVHATLAGVLVALTVPLKEKDGYSPLKTLEHGLHPWVAFMIVPVFAFFNAGVSFKGISIESVLAPIPLGIALGLFVGKQLGVFVFSWVAVKAGICRLPKNVNFAKVYGVACLTGIGFTMSLFIGTLAFSTDEQLNAVRLGVILGSVLSTILGVVVLKRSLVESKLTVPKGHASANV